MVGLSLKLLATLVLDTSVDTQSPTSRVSKPSKLLPAALVRCYRRMGVTHEPFVRAGHPAEESKQLPPSHQTTRSTREKDPKASKE